MTWNLEMMVAEEFSIILNLIQQSHNSPEFKLAFWGTIKKTPSQLKPENVFPNSVPSTLFHNKLISGLARKEKIKNSQKDFIYLYQIWKCIQELLLIEINAN